VLAARIGLFVSDGNGDRAHAATALPGLLGAGAGAAGDGMVCSGHPRTWLRSALQVPCQVRIAIFREIAPRRAARYSPAMTSGSDDSTTVAALKARVLAFARERDWEQFHSPKNLSMALAAEAGELMEPFLWVSPEEARRLAADPARQPRIADELADVVVYALQFANMAGIDLSSAIATKMAANAAKYPVERARSRSDKYDEL